MIDGPVQREPRRLTAVAGLLALAMLLAELVTWGNPQLSDPVSRLHELFASQHAEASVSLTLAALAVIPLLIFSAGIRTLAHRTHAAEVWPAVLTAATAVFAATQVTFAALSGALVAAAPSATGHELSLLLGPLTYLDAARFTPFAVMAAAASLLILRTATFGRWIAFVGLASAACNIVSQFSLLDFTGTGPVSKLGDAGQLGFLLFGVWTIAIAVTLLRNSSTVSARTQDTALAPAGSR